MKFLLFTVALGQIAVQIGSDCSSTNGDEFACSDNFFLTCVEQKWIVQNTCTAICKDDSALNWQCYRNRINSIAKTTVVATAASMTGTKTQSTSYQTPAASTSFDSKASASSDQSNSPQPPIFTIALIAGGTIIAIILFIFFFVKCSRSGFFFTTTGQRREIETPVAVLQQMYVVVKPYLQCRSDEVTLYTGNQIELYVLYNDGWAKGCNITTGMSGLIPVTHLDILEIDSNIAPRTRFPSGGSQSRLFII